MKINKTILIAILIMTFILSSCSAGKLEYQGRQYKGPNTYNLVELKKRFGYNLHPIGDQVNGMQVMLSNEGKEKIDKYHIVPTILILKKHEDEYLVYSLQGGP